MGGATNVLPLYVFMSKKGKNLFLYLQYLDHCENEFWYYSFKPTSSLSLSLSLSFSLKSRIYEEQILAQAEKQSFAVYRAAPKFITMLTKTRISEALSSNS